MVYDFLIKDLKIHLSQKSIGTDKGLAKIGDGIVNLIYSLAKSIYLTKNSNLKLPVRTGTKVSKSILSDALKQSDMKEYSKVRSDAHDLADTVEAIIAFVWLNGSITIDQMTNLLVESLNGDLNNRKEEIINAKVAFSKLLNSLKQYLPRSQE
ncbi:MAG: ribonuclease III family protein [Candidatus Thorarchaeota archaeon]